MKNLERQLDKETLHEKDSNFDLSVIKVQFDQFIHSKVLEPSNYNSYGLETRRDFKHYTQMELQTFKEAIIQNIDSIEECIVERARHEQEMHNRMKRLNERKLQIQECMVQKDKASDASLGEKDCSRIVSDKENDQDIKPCYDTKPMVKVPYIVEYNVFAVDTQHSEQPECIINTCVVEKVDSNVIPDSPDMCDNDIQTNQNTEDERVALANLIANLKLDIDENKMIQKQLKKANSSLTQELKKCNSIQDSCLVALQNKQTKLEKYMAFNDRTVDYDKLE
ncbi:hypothetical protein Tco_0055206, partial [Tanacetum coccineum]